MFKTKDYQENTTTCAAAIYTHTHTHTHWDMVGKMLGLLRVALLPDSLQDENRRMS